MVNQRLVTTGFALAVDGPETPTVDGVGTPIVDGPETPSVDGVGTSGFAATVSVDGGGGASGSGLGTTGFVFAVDGPSGTAGRSARLPITLDVRRLIRSDETKDDRPSKPIRPMMAEEMTTTINTLVLIPPSEGGWRGGGKGASPGG